MIYAPGSRATRGITILVTDETGNPVPNVAVSFRLPDDGPSGVFSSGAKTEIVTTRDDGRASVWGMRWSKTPGTLQIRITAARDGVRAGTVATQYLNSSAPATTAARSGSHNKLLMVTLAVAGAAGAGIALSMSRGSQGSAASAAAPASISIGAPRITVGTP